MHWEPMPRRLRRGKTSWWKRLEQIFDLVYSSNGEGVSAGQVGSVSWLQLLLSKNLVDQGNKKHLDFFLGTGRVGSCFLAFFLKSSGWRWPLRFFRSVFVVCVRPSLSWSKFVASLSFSCIILEDFPRHFLAGFLKREKCLFYILHHHLTSF